MRVKFLVCCAGPAGVFNPGQEATVSEEFGQQLIDGRYAELVVKPAPADRGGETATINTPEQAVTRRRK